MNAIIKQTIGIVYWNLNEGSFDLELFKVGAIGSVFLVIGLLSNNIALGASEAVVLPVAILSCKMIVLTVAVSLISGAAPTPTQIVALAFGMMGALILIMPT